MKEFKGTKGKWEVLDWDSNYRIMSGYSVITSISKDPDNCGNIECCGTEKANATLISKSPEMLSALLISTAQLKVCLDLFKLNKLNDGHLLSNLENQIKRNEELIQSATDLTQER